MSKITIAKWYRKARIDGYGQGQDVEIWEAADSKGNIIERHDVLVQTGKPINLFTFKPSTAASFKANVDSVTAIRKKILRNLTDKIKSCPICGVSSLQSSYQLTVYGGKYHQCKKCGHCYIINRPSKEAVENYYKSSEYHVTYTNKKISEERIKQIYIPKAKWIIDAFKHAYGRKPTRILDIGAGAGHFIYACQQLGLKAYGVELSDASCRFAKDHFGIQLDNVDISKEYARYKDIDIVTFWGVIEHVTIPNDLLNVARQILTNKKSLVISEVPHWNCMSTVLQKASPHIVMRHLDPVGHINCFTETSLLTAYHQSGFVPKVAWYYGMDFYEAITHLLYQLKDDRIAKILGPILNDSQYIFDRGRLSDTIILAGKPNYC